MPKVAVTIPYFDFFPELKAQLAERYPGAKFRADRRKLEEDELIDYLRGYEAALIGLSSRNSANAYGSRDERKPKELRSFWPNCRRDTGPSRAAVTGCRGQQPDRLDSMDAGVADRRFRIAEATSCTQ